MGEIPETGAKRYTRAWQCFLGWEVRMIAEKDGVHPETVVRDLRRVAKEITEQHKPIVKWD